ncbi:helix-turn-helix domain-containing protein [Marinilabilia sp.]|uniref:AlbA family DNA-binding domain-containing protein n=1 Tax=Marinilabilia sp. TaxID=2021252 RepID=UPI0025BEED93|nr:ATP-binding protein [Marinilabilia sp.]
MKKYFKSLFLWQLIAGAFFMFILAPLLIATFQYELSGHESSFSEILSHIYSVYFPPTDIGIFFTDISILIVGIVFATLFYRYSKRKRDKMPGTSEIVKLIEKGENEKVEFKASLRHDYRQIKTDKNLEHVILKSIAGFMNGKGGTLLIGVDDYGEVLGLENDYWSLKKKNKDGFEQRLMLIISNAFGKDACSKVHVSFHTINEKEICSLFIERSKQPVYFEDTNKTIFFLRTGNVTYPLNTKETVEYLHSQRS